MLVGGSRQESVAVCTIEKANMAVNKLLQEGRLGGSLLLSAHCNPRKTIYWLEIWMKAWGLWS